MKKTTILAALVIAFMTTACGDKKDKTSENTSEKIEVVHELDSISVNVNPKRVVVFDFAAMETLNELGIKPVGVPAQFVPEHLKHLKADKDIADVGSMFEPNFEKIYALQPDLIIISARSEKFYKQLSEIAPTIYSQVDNSNYIESFEKVNTILGKVFNRENDVQKRIDELKTSIQNAKEKIGELNQKALVIIYNKGKFSAYGKGSRFGFIHDVMGVQPIDESLEIATHGQPVSNEYIESKNPDILFIMDRSSMVNGIKTDPKEIENALIQRTNAYKNNKIIYLDPQIWYLSGGGLTSAEQMVKDVTTAVLN